MSVTPEFATTLLSETWFLPREIVQRFYYGNPNDAPEGTLLTIVKEKGFQATDFEVPTQPLNQLEGIPILFGSPNVEFRNHRLVVHADLIASTFFMMTRQEEKTRRQVRDRHGRFPGTESLPFRNGFLERPVVDEYGKWIRHNLRQMGLQIDEPTCKPRLVLTHDVDRPFQNYFFSKSVRQCASRIFKRNGNPIQPLLSWAGVTRDAYDTFDWIDQQNKSIESHEIEVEEVFFVMACDPGPHDGNYRVESKRIRQLLDKIIDRGATIGLHPSYAAGQNPELVAVEKERLEKTIGTKVTKSRNHYLRSREPEHVSFLIDAGILDDYTGGYADQPGFRYGTAQPFRYFDVENNAPTDLVLHPLQTMEVTLQSEQYLGLSIDDAINRFTKIAKKTFEHSGELVVLWHNCSFGGPAADYHRKLYQESLNSIKLLSSKKKAI